MNKIQARNQKRKPPSRLANERFLIVTEGEKTEPFYFKALRDKLRLSTLDVRILHPKFTDPENLAKAAIKEKTKNSGVNYDQVWVVFDLERQTDFRRQQATTAKNSSGSINHQLKFAESDPSFEYWILLHFEYTIRSFEDCKSLESYIKENYPEIKYSKSKFDVEFVLENTEVALKHVNRLRKEYEQTGQTSPATSVDLLVQTLFVAAES